VVLGLVATPAAWGQNVKPAGPDSKGGAHRMEILDGPSRTVHYFAPGSSPGEQQMYRDLARAENEQGYAERLMALRKQYVAGEQGLESARANLQPLLYGRAVDQPYAAGYLGCGWGGGGWGWGGWGGGGWGGGGWGGYGGVSGTTTQSLGIGIGPEGAIKEAMAKVMAQQATPEYAAAVDRQLAQISSNFKGGDKPGTIRLVGPEEVPAPAKVVTATLKGGDKIEGRLVSEGADWLVIQTANGEEKVRMSEVMRITTKKDGK
jgi:hypothetical protein